MKKAAWLASTLFLISCSGDAVKVDSSPESAISAGMAMISGAVNAASTSSASISRTACGTPAAAETCSGGVRKGVWNQTCTVAATQHRYYGSVTLTYSASNCDLDAQGTTLTRTLDMIRELIYDSEEYSRTGAQTTTVAHEDFRGVLFGAGTKLTRVDPTVVSLDVLGVRKVRFVDGTDSPIYDVSMRTLQPVNIDHTGGSLSGLRTVTGGKLELVHHRALYVASVIPTNLKYDSATCCHPTSGTLAVEYLESAKTSGTASVSFAGSACGTASFTRDGETKQILLHGCE